MEPAALADSDNDGGGLASALLGVARRCAAASAYLLGTAARCVTRVIAPPPPPARAALPPPPASTTALDQAQDQAVPSPFVACSLPPERPLRLPGLVRAACVAGSATNFLSALATRCARGLMRAASWSETRAGGEAGVVEVAAAGGETDAEMEVEPTGAAEAGVGETRGRRLRRLRGPTPTSQLVSHALHEMQEAPSPAARAAAAAVAKAAFAAARDETAGRASEAPGADVMDAEAWAETSGDEFLGAETSGSDTSAANMLRTETSGVAVSEPEILEAKTLGTEAMDAEILVPEIVGVKPSESKASAAMLLVEETSKMEPEILKTSGTEASAAKFLEEETSGMLASVLEILAVETLKNEVPETLEPEVGVGPSVSKASEAKSLGVKTSGVVKETSKPELLRAKASLIEDKAVKNLGTETSGAKASQGVENSETEDSKAENSGAELFNVKNSGTGASRAESSLAFLCEDTSGTENSGCETTGTDASEVEDYVQSSGAEFLEAEASGAEEGGYVRVGMEITSADTASGMEALKAIEDGHASGLDAMLLAAALGMASPDLVEELQVSGMETMVATATMGLETSGVVVDGKTLRVQPRPVSELSEVVHDVEVLRHPSAFEVATSEEKSDGENSATEGSAAEDGETSTTDAALGVGSSWAETSGAETSWAEMSGAETSVGETSGPETSEAEDGSTVDLKAALGAGGAWEELAGTVHYGNVFEVDAMLMATAMEVQALRKEATEALGVDARLMAAALGMKTLNALQLECDDGGPSGADTSGTETSGTETSRMETSGTEISGTDISGTEISGTSRAGTSSSETPCVVTTRTVTSGLEPSRATMPWSGSSEEEDGSETSWEEEKAERAEALLPLPWSSSATCSVVGSRRAHFERLGVSSSDSCAVDASRGVLREWLRGAGAARPIAMGASRDVPDEGAPVPRDDAGTGVPQTTSRASARAPPPLAATSPPGGQPTPNTGKQSTRSQRQARQVIATNERQPASDSN